MTFTQRLIHTPALYRQTFSWLASVAVISLIVDHIIRPSYGIAALAFVAILIVLLAMRREVSEVRGLVNHRHDELLDRVDQLTGALIAAGIKVPVDPVQPQSGAP
jgi:hypothetical protein